MKILMTCMGTLGDLYPYLTLGTELAARKHEVIVFSDATKREAVESAGLLFEPVLSNQEWERFATHPALSNPDSCMAVMFKYQYLPAMLPTYERVLQHHEEGNTLLVGGAGTFGFRLASDARNIPLVCLYLAPYQMCPMRGTNDDEDENEKNLSTLVNDLRRQIGLSDLHEPVAQWLSSADLAVTAYPEWFSNRRPRCNLRNFSFGNFLYGAASHTRDASDWEPFINEGSPPVIFTLGTGMHRGEGFFRAALSCCERLSLRGIFLANQPGQLPSDLPPTIHASRYIPFERVLPRSAGIVHHAGVGTCAEALRAGVPQLVMPHMFDQFDNAEQIERLGIGLIMSPEEIGTPAFAEKLALLQSSAQLKATSRHASVRMRKADARRDIANLIEYHFDRRSQTTAHSSQLC
jgi:UDP:flavonoid glycosyltransferase YjiC (YdhE family)